MIYTDGSVYEGSWMNNYPNGTGNMLFANGDKFDGQFVHGTIEGYGTMNYAAGDIYVGFGTITRKRLWENEFCKRRCVRRELEE